MREQLEQATQSRNSDGSASGRVLVLRQDDAESGRHMADIASKVESADVQHVYSLRAYREALTTKDFDVIVIDYDMPGVASRELLMQLQLRDHEPEVLLVSSCDSPQKAKSIASARKRYVVRDGNWGDEVTYAIRDMLRIRRLEEEMSFVRARLTELNGRLEEKNRRLDEFCATVAHDIRGPLAGLMLKIDYLMGVLPVGTDSRCAGMLQKSYDSAERLVTMLQAMYEYARAGLQGVSYERVSLSDLVRVVVDDLVVDDALDVCIEIGEMPTIVASAGLLKRIFINLISNSIKYADKDSIKIAVGCLDLESQRNRASVEIFVDDNGPGVAESEASDIFEMFSRGTPVHPHTDGLGVGLAVVRRIVEMHQGEIRLGVSPLGGARFVVTLPLEQSGI
jgi:signal transduction histidine kinase